MISFDPIQKHALVELLIYILALIAIIILFSYLLQTTFGYTEKNANLTIGKGEMAYCYFGNPEVSTPVCSVMDVKKDTFNLIDGFMRFLAYGPIVVNEK